jgi:hypothetical protein
MFRKVEENVISAAIGLRETPETTPDRRRTPRYRFSVPIAIRSSGGASMRGITIEISETGTSAIIAGSLKVADTVELEPIADGVVQAAVRHNVGKVYGFEFLNLSVERTARIRESCKMLPRYQSKALGI